MDISRVLITLHFLIAIILIVIILLQKSGEDGSLFSKANQNRVDKVDSNIIKVTVFFVGVFIINSIAILYVKNSSYIRKMRQNDAIHKSFDQDL